MGTAETTEVDKTMYAIAQKTKNPFFMPLASCCIISPEGNTNHRLQN
jgi:hypothetical protein